MGNLRKKCLKTWHKASLLPIHDFRENGSTTCQTRTFFLHSISQKLKFHIFSEIALISPYTSLSLSLHAVPIWLPSVDRLIPKCTLTSNTPWWENYWYSAFNSFKAGKSEIHHGIWGRFKYKLSILVKKEYPTNVISFVILGIIP